MPINLYVNTYKDKDRQDELDFCEKKNSENSFLKINIIDGRPTFSEIFKMCSDDINIVANADIYFDETINFVNGLQDNEVMCLTRWENGKLFNRRDSQDAWIFKGRPDVKADFTMGTAGCDNVLAHLFQGQKTSLHL